MKAAYLIHFSEPFSHARHYAGATLDLQARLIRHASGHGAKLLAALRDAGISWTCVAAWRPCWAAERYLKQMNNSPRYCPLCCKKPRGVPNAIFYDAADLATAGIILDSDLLARQPVPDKTDNDLPF